MRKVGGHFPGQKPISGFLQAEVDTAGSTGREVTED